MDENKRTELGAKLKTAREAVGWSTYQLAREAGVNQSTVVRIEQGAFATVAPDRLSRLAEALKIPAADLFALVEYTTPTDLPQFAPYMRAKYRDLTADDVTLIESFAATIANRRGVNLRGPRPGEDE